MEWLEETVVKCGLYISSDSAVFSIVPVRGRAADRDRASSASPLPTEIADSGPWSTTPQQARSSPYRNTVTIGNISILSHDNRNQLKITSPFTISHNRQFDQHNQRGIGRRLPIKGGKRDPTRHQYLQGARIAIIINISEYLKLAVYTGVTLHFTLYVHAAHSLVRTSVRCE